MQSISPHTILIDANKALTAANTLFDGMGFISANNSSRLLLDYKAEHPEVYWRLLEYTFGESGLGLNLIKVEMGADVDSSSGTEPAVMRAADEPADVTRGAGYQLVADALTINPDLQVDMLYWGIPAWVASAENKYAAMYVWYKSTIDAMYATYGIRLTHVTLTQNEKDFDVELIKYIARALKEEKSTCYDYSQIKIVAGEGIENWNIADAMLADEELMDAVDIISSHYTSWTSENAKLLQKEYGKKLWFSEGSSPMSNSRLVCKYDGNGSGISGLNGMLDIATRITQAMAEGMSMYEFQPVISAYYSGVTYFPKQLILANEPWSGAYSLDAGFYMALHFTKFIGKGWAPVAGACFGDGKPGGDGHCIEGSTYNYATFVDEEMENCSIVLVNATAEPISYEIKLHGLNCADKPFYLWESRGLAEDDGDYFANFFRMIGDIVPRDGKLALELKPYSMMTASTAKVERIEYEEIESKLLELPYTDDFEYAPYPANYLKSRGFAPRYTTDQGGAFEVEERADGNVLMQQITFANKPIDWGYTSEPTTNLGDDRWSNYTASVDAHFADSRVDAHLADEKVATDARNYVGLGARYNLADAAYSGYWVKLYEDGACELLKDEAVLAEAAVAGLDIGAWHNLSLTVNATCIMAAIDGNTIITFQDEKVVAISGRVALYSAYQKNYFNNLKVEPTTGADSYINPYITRIDNLNPAITYSDGSNVDDGKGWFFNTMSSFKNYNRTISVGSAGDSFSFTFEGTGFAVIGATTDAVLSVIIDGTQVEAAYVAEGAIRKSAYTCYGLEQKTHAVGITIEAGSLEFDVLEVW